MSNESSKYPPQIKIALRIIGGLVVIAAIFLGGVYVGYDNRPAFAKVTSVVHQTDTTVSTADFAPFWKAWQVVSQNFAAGKNASATTDQDHIYGAIQGMVASFGDPYTTFFPPAENTQFQSQIAGEFSGIGIEIGEKDGALTVIAPLKGTPADIAGVKSGDQIIKIDNTITSAVTVDQAIDMIRGKDGTAVTLTLARQGAATPIVLTITRNTINLPTVDTENRSAQGVFIIHLYSFSAQSPGLFKTIAIWHPVIISSCSICAAIRVAIWRQQCRLAVNLFLKAKRLSKRLAKIRLILLLTTVRDQKFFPTAISSLFLLTKARLLPLKF
jgi:carboxyl-terminal processing protease